MSEYEQILRHIGAFGPYQMRAFVLVSMFETPLAWAMLAPILLNLKPDFYCYDVESLENYMPKNETDLFLRSFDSLHQLYDKLSANITFNRTKNACPNNKVCKGIEFDSSMNTIVSQWNLVCDQEIVAETITSIQMAGVLFGAIITGQLADLFGRRSILFLEHATLVIIWFCSAFAADWMIYAALRFIIGALIGGVLVVNFVLPLELVTPEWRTFCGCIGLWAVGLMTLAGWGYMIRDWQYLIIATSTASAFILLSWWFIPESPRWLLSRGRVREAEKILTDMAKFNKKAIPDFSRLRQYAEDEIKLHKERRKYSYWHLCSSWTLTKHTLILVYGWFVSSAVYYGMNFNTKNLTGDLYLNMFLSGLVEIPALAFVVLVHNRLGRRRTVSSLMFVAGIFSFSILILDLTGNTKKFPTIALVFALVGKAGISGGWAALQVFSAELFPTVIRNIGVGACSFFARVGAIVAPQIVFLGTKMDVPLPFTVFGVIAIFCGILVWLLPETGGKPLQDELIIKSPDKVSIPDETNEHDVANVTEMVPLKTLECTTKQTNDESTVVINSQSAVQIQ